MLHSREEPSLFLTTQWSMVQGALAGGKHEEVQRCLARMCEVYWRPLYRFARRQGHATCDAEDLVQGFFEILLSRSEALEVTPERGKFRSYLLAAFKKHMAGVWRWRQREKRGGSAVTLSLDWESEESGLKLEAEDRESPDVLFDRDWAKVLLGLVLAKVEQEFEEMGKAHEFAAMRGYLAMRSEQLEYRELADILELSEGAARVAVHRLRKRYRTALKEEVARPLVDPEAVEAEMRALFLALTER